MTELRSPTRPARTIAVPDLAADRDRALALTPVSRETLARLDRFIALLFDWQARMNLVAPSTLPQVWTRHVADSLQLLALAPEARIWADLGSGAGFPGIVLACALADTKRAEVHLVESIAKKAAFLATAIAETGVAATVHHMRIEDFVRHDEVRPDVVTARALAPLPRLLELTAPLLQKGAQGLFPKGQDVEAELTEAAKYWTLQSSFAPSLTSPESRILVVHKAVWRH
ncbi:16S rRNA (guanine(527)-N(7))-methyltransferase RsmG [Xanthobacteraceae bacterium Astr-EGSB]|uniref:16S rRNA (guanine(527)-N(7))-methyltransferase RsmG n=1 Tax=Astrobacterium formosum TaxID=3069710 RepID=UPI0027B4B5C5|nr:16S rRNA (guanine(527)-N(7))-methyltransferase RsmG [Xanthobacteraceae bacterium Astr-EGSB]